jgi:hypothetical protein
LLANTLGSQEDNQVEILNNQIMLFDKRTDTLLYSPDFPQTTKQINFKRGGGLLVRSPKDKRPPTMVKLVYTNRDLIDKIRTRMMLERMEEDGRTETADNYSHKI